IIRRRSSGRNQDVSLRTRRLASTAENQPRNKLPERLIKKVPQGKPVPNNRAAKTVTPQRSSPPMADPKATRPTWTRNRIARFSGSSGSRESTEFYFQFFPL